jgi:uncharacterized protein (DUF1800 family)
MALAFCLIPAAYGAIDDNATQQLWKLKYGVTDVQIADSVWLNQDADGDGIKNGGEMAAGTNPFNATKTIAVSSVAKNGSNADLQFPTENGKLYRVQSTSTLTDANSWVMQPQPTPVQVIGDGGTKTLTVPYLANSFYRIFVSDTDSDGDGLSDWSERAVGLNPNSSQSVPGTDDHVYVNQQIALPNVVTIAAAEPFASEDGPTAGKLTVTRSQNLVPITVNYDVTGTAVPTTDYSPLAGSVSFTARGATTADIFVNPTVQAAVKGGRSVTATLSPPGQGANPFSIGAQNKATVIINDSIVPSGTGLLARYYDTSSSNYVDAANFGQSTTTNFTYTRSGSSPYSGSTILVPFTYNGTPALQVGQQVKLSFTSGALDNSSFDNQIYTVTAVTAGASFTVGISGATLPTSYNGSCNFSIQSFTHPAFVERIDPTVNFDWGYGTPNDVAVTPNSPVDNYSTVFEGYLNPTVAGNYQFQLDADDKARLLIDLNGDGDFLDAGEQVLEHGWDGATTPETIGTFKQSAVIALAVPATPAQRYKIRVEHVETTGDARCRLQWLVPGTTSYANIPQANVYSHMQTLTNYTVTSSVATITTAAAHGLTAGASNVTLYFTAGSLFTPPANYSGTYTVATTPTSTTFTISVPGAANQTATTGLMFDPTSTTTGWLNQVYTNTTFTAPAGYVNIVGAGATNSNNGIWGSGSPDPSMGKDTFSARWTGQVQPQYSEDYTFVVQADDGVSLWLNGQLQEMKTLPSTSTGIANYDYSTTNGDAIVNYTGGVVKPGSFIVGESVRVDPSSGNLTHGTGSTYTFDGTTGYLTVDYSNLTNITPGGFVAGETIELDPTAGTLSALVNLPYVIFDEPSTTTFRVFIGTGIFDSQTTPATINIADTRNAVVSKVFATGATYSYSSTTGDLVVTYSAVTGVAPSAFTTGMTVELDPTSGNLTALNNASYTITAATATTFTVNIGAGLYTNGSTGNINIASSANGVIPVSITNAFAINFGTAKYSTGTGNINVEIANKPLKEWSSMTNERYVRIPVIGGTRYDIQLDFSENTGYSRCVLSWYSASQPKQVIPVERLYPKSVPQAPPAHVSPTAATALVNGQFSYQVAGTNGATVTVDKPGWLNYSGGVLSGTPPSGTAGDYQVVITATNSAGTGTSVLNLHVDENAGTVPREYWNGVAGTTVASIPTSTPPTGTANLTSLQAPSNFGTNYGARIRGYITAPVTGNYYFWIAANNAAELWISNDDEPVNAFKRAWVTTGNSAPQTWNGEATQKSPWLALEQGKKYYFEVLHKAGSGAGDNLAVGWAKPGDALTTPSQVVPGFALSPYVPPAAGSTPGTLYVATMLSQSGAATNGVGNSTLRLSEDENTAYMTYTYSGLTGPITSQHIHTDAYLSKPSTIVYDIDTPATAGDGLITNPADPNFGAHKWTITPVGTLTKADIIEIIKEGKAYINLHTTLYPNGEIRGNYTLAVGSRTFTAPPAPPAWTDDAGLAGSAGDAARARFLSQATFGPNIADMTALKTLGSYNAWIDAQFNMSTSLTSRQLPEVIRTENASAQGGAFSSTLTYNAWWKNSLSGPDQLRQRIAFALSQIHVVSTQGPLDNNALATSYFYDKLADNAFGNFKDILKDTTLTPSMGRYLDMLRNDKPDQTVGRIPNENYAREIKQLFSVGLYRMWPDGTLMLTSKDAPIDTYTQREIVGLAHVFTGWDYGYDGPFHTSFSSSTNWTRQMRETPARHYTGQKRTLNNEVLPGLSSMGGQPLDPNATHTFNNYTDATYQALPAQELEKAHDLLFNHPNVGPFICRQLIQRMVTSNPSRDYLYRVVQKFNDNGSGVRGDMKAVIKAILLDYEARSPALLDIPAYGKQREPIMRVAAAGRAFRPTAFTGTYAQSATPAASARNITVTTDTPHNLATGNNVFLDFTSGSPAPWIGSYSATVTDATHFTVPAQGWASGTYSVPANSTVMTVTITSHWLQTGHKAYLVYHTPTGPAMTDGIITVASSGTTDNPNAVVTNTFTVTVIPNATARSGSVLMPKFSPGSYTVSASGLAAPNDRRVTMDTNVNHELSVGDHVWINFYDGNPKPNDIEAVVESVVDLNTWTFLAPSAGTNLSTLQALDQVYQFPLKALPLTRNGNVGSRPSTFAMGETTTTLQQSPISSPTVFNFFLPDFKYPGALASQGITTPEFQLTAETTAISQANYIYNGVFNPTSNTSGLSSFSSGNNSLVMDTSPWMPDDATDLGLGAPTDNTLPWTHNQNIPTLVDHLSTVLAAGQLSSNVKTVIRNFIARPIASIVPGTVPATSPCVVTTVGNHGYTTGDTVYISGVTGGTFNPVNTFNTTTVTGRAITVTGPTTFTVTGVTCTVAATGFTNAHVSPVSYNMGTTTPTATDRRDRLRSIIHLILTSPDFTIQR